MLKGEDVRIALLKEGYTTWKKFPANNSMVNIEPVLDSFRNKYKQDITPAIIDQVLQGLLDEKLMEFYQFNEDNLVALLTPTGRSYFVDYQDKRRNKILAMLGAILGSLGFILSLSKIIWDVIQ